MSDRVRTAAVKATTSPSARERTPSRQCEHGHHVISGSTCDRCAAGSSQLQSAGVPGLLQPIHTVVQHALTTPGFPLDGVTRRLMEQRIGSDFSRIPVQLSSRRLPKIASIDDPLERAADLAAERAFDSRRSLPAFAADFARVRLHVGPVAEAAARLVKARAFSVGDHIVFGEGQYRPTGLEGRRLLAHELAHVAQQVGGAMLFRKQLPGDDPIPVGSSDIDSKDEDEEGTHQPKDSTQNATHAPAAAGGPADARQGGAPGGPTPVRKGGVGQPTPPPGLDGAQPAATAQPADKAPQSPGELPTADLALIDFELAEHERWGAAAAIAGTAGSAQRANFLAESAGSGAAEGFKEGALQGAKTAIEMKIAEKLVEKVAVGIAVRLGAQAAKFTPLPGVGAVIGGVLAGIDLAKRDWGATGKAIAAFGKGADIYDQLANSIESISTVLEVATQVANVIAGILGAITIIMWIVSVATVGVTSPLAATLTSISLAIGLGTMVLDGINALVLKELITTFRALHAFASDADPRDVVEQGKAIQGAAAGATGFVGGLVGAKAGEKGMHFAKGKLPVKLGGHPKPPAATGEGPSVKAEPPKPAEVNAPPEATGGAAGKTPAEAGGVPAPAAPEPEKLTAPEQAGTQAAPAPAAESPVELAKPAAPVEPPATAPSVPAVEGAPELAKATAVPKELEVKAVPEKPAGAAEKPSASTSAEPEVKEPSGNKPPPEEPAGAKPKPENDPRDVADFEARQAAFEAGKLLETGKVKIKTRKTSNKSFSPPKGKTLERLRGNSQEAKKLRKNIFGPAQGRLAGEIFLENIKQRSASSHFGEASQRLVPELGFHNKKIVSVGKPPGGQPKGARTADLGIAKETISPEKWNTLKKQRSKAVLDETLDLKLGEGKIERKAEFRKQVGLEPQELTPFTQGLKPGEFLPEPTGGGTGGGTTGGPPSGGGTGVAPASGGKGPPRSQFSSEEIQQERLETIAERRRIGGVKSLVEPEFQDIREQQPKALRRGESKLLDRSEVSPHVKESLRAEARERFGKRMQEALNDEGKHTALTQETLKHLRPDQVEAVRRTGRMPQGFEFHHLLTIADYPEFGHLAESGLSLPKEVHNQAGHGGDTTRPVEAATYVEPGAIGHPAFSSDPEARKFHRAKARDIAEGRAASSGKQGGVDRDLGIETEAKLQELEQRAQEAEEREQRSPTPQNRARTRAARAEADRWAQATQDLQAAVPSPETSTPAQTADIEGPTAATGSTEEPSAQTAPTTATADTEVFTAPSTETADVETSGPGPETTSSALTSPGAAPTSSTTTSPAPAASQPATAPIQQAAASARSAASAPTALEPDRSLAVDPNAPAGTAREQPTLRPKEPPKGTEGPKTQAESPEPVAQPPASALASPAISTSPAAEGLSTSAGTTASQPTTQTTGAGVKTPAAGATSVPESQAPSGPQPAPETPSGTARPTSTTPASGGGAPAGTASPATTKQTTPVPPGAAARGASGQASGEGDIQSDAPIVERVSPQYLPPPATPDDLVSLRNQIIDTLAARAQTEQFAAKMAEQQKHHEENRKPLESMKKGNEESISATQAHQQAIANRNEANKRKKDSEEKVKSKIDDYSNRAGQLTSLTVPLKGLSKFTGLANSLPDEPHVVRRFKRKVLKVNSDSNKFLGQLDQMDHTMTAQKDEHAQRDQGIKADAETIKNTDTQADESAESFDFAKEATDDFDNENQDRIKDSSEQKTAAHQSAAKLDAQAKKKESQAVSLAAAMQFWAHDHQQARRVALEQTKTRLETQGYRVTEVRER